MNVDGIGNNIKTNLINRISSESASHYDAIYILIGEEKYKKKNKTNS